jgi:hypothetical protein
LFLSVLFCFTRSYHFPPLHLFLSFLPFCRQSCSLLSSILLFLHFILTSFYPLFHFVFVSFTHSLLRFSFSVACDITPYILVDVSFHISLGPFIFPLLCISFSHFHYSVSPHFPRTGSS